jgi:histidyl-tRNA synthetase
MLGEDEVKAGQVVIKDLRRGEQQTLDQAEAAAVLRSLLQ